MATLSASYVEILEQWTEGDMTGKKFSCRSFKITVPATDATAYGDATNTIPASVFGLSVLIESSPLYAETSTDARKMVPTQPLPNAVESTSVLYSYGGVATAIGLPNTALVKRFDGSNAGVFYGTVKGWV